MIILINSNNRIAITQKAKRMNTTANVRHDNSKNADFDNPKKE